MERSNLLASFTSAFGAVNESSIELTDPSNPLVQQVNYLNMSVQPQEPSFPGYINTERVYQYTPNPTRPLNQYSVAPSASISSVVSTEFNGTHLPDISENDFHSYFDFDNIEPLSFENELCVDDTMSSVESSTSPNAQPEFRQESSFISGKLSYFPYQQNVVRKPQECSNIVTDNQPDIYSQSLKPVAIVSPLFDKHGENAESVTQQNFTSAKGKEGIRAKNRDYYTKNRVAIRAKQQDYYTKNKDTLRAQQRDYTTKNKDTLRAGKQNYYIKNKDAIRAQQRDYRAKNKDALRAKKKDCYKKNKESVPAISTKSVSLDLATPPPDFQSKD